MRESRMIEVVPVYDAEFARVTEAMLEIQAREVCSMQQAQADLEKIKEKYGLDDDPS